MAAETADPARASARSAAEAARLARRERARYERQAESQPTPTASEPTSVTGTSSASPRKAAAAVKRAINQIAFDGVPWTGCTRESEGCTRSRRPMPKSRRVAATKFPLKILTSDRNAAKTII